MALSISKKICAILITSILIVAIVGVSIALVFATGLYTANFSINFHIDPVPPKPNFVLNFSPSTPLYMYTYEWGNSEYTGRRTARITSNYGLPADYLPGEEYAQVMDPGDIIVNGYNYGTYFFNSDPQSPTVNKTQLMDDLPQDLYLSTYEFNAGDYAEYDAENISYIGFEFTIVNPTDNYLYFMANYSSEEGSPGDTYVSYTVESIGYAQVSGSFGEVADCNQYFTSMAFAEGSFEDSGWGEDYSTTYNAFHDSYLMLKPDSSSLIDDLNYAVAGDSGGMFNYINIDEMYYAPYVFINPRGAIKCKFIVEYMGDLMSDWFFELQFTINFLNYTPTTSEDWINWIETSANPDTATTFNILTGLSTMYI